MSAPYPFGSVPRGQCDCPACRLRDWHYRAVHGSLGAVIDWLADECVRAGEQQPDIGVALEPWRHYRRRWSASICGHEGQGETEWQALCRAWEAFAAAVAAEREDVAALDAAHCGRTA